MGDGASGIIVTTAEPSTDTSAQAMVSYGRFTRSTRRLTLATTSATGSPSTSRGYTAVVMATSRTSATATTKSADKRTDRWAWALRLN